ncbi:MAG: putative sulfate exporter family transporter, partial [Marmoricola sp.]
MPILGLLAAVVSTESWSVETLTVDRPAIAAMRRPAALPGVLLAVAGGAIGMAAGHLDSIVSPLLVAMALGMLAANVVTLPSSLRPGLTWAGRTLLRAGVVLLGLQLSLRDVAALGPGVLAVVVAVVVTGVAGGRWLGMRLGLSQTQSLLIACGFSICGAAAVAAVEGSIDAEDEEVATAVALVVAFGTAMIGLLPALAGLLGLSHRVAGVWAGASIHEVAQVVAAGGVIGGGAVAAAVVVKLARVLLLAPVV